MYKLQVSGNLRLSVTVMVLCPLCMGPCTCDVLRWPLMKQRRVQTSKTTAGSLQSQNNVGDYTAVERRRPNVRLETSLIVSYSLRKKHNCYDEFREAEYLLITSYSFRWSRIGSLLCVSLSSFVEKRCSSCA